MPASLKIVTGGLFHQSLTNRANLPIAVGMEAGQAQGSDSPTETAKESVHLIKSKWGEGITGLVGIGAWTVFAMIPVGILLGVGVAIRNRDATLGAALIAISVGAILLVSALSLATRQVFSVALYRYASGVPDTGGFAAADLEEPFRRRGGSD